jgi:hypothetical protein
MATKIYEERLKHPHQRDGDSPGQLLDTNRTALLKAVSNPSGVLLQRSSKFRLDLNRWVLTPRKTRMMLM